MRKLLASFVRWTIFRLELLALELEPAPVPFAAGPRSHDPSRTCIAWGPLELGFHPDCPVVMEEAESRAPVVCPCECRTCRRAWFADRSPIVRDGRVVRKDQSP